MYCKHCGEKIVDGSSFCNFCGGSQGASVDEANTMKLSIYDENKRFLRGTLILFLGLILTWWVGRFLEDFWLIDVFYPAMAGFWIGLWLNMIAKIPRWLKDSIRVIVLVAAGVAYYLIPAYGGFYDGLRGRNIEEYFFLFIAIGWCCGYVEEENDRMWEWILGFGISFLMLAFVSYISHYVNYTHYYLQHLNDVVDWTNIEGNSNDMLYMPARIANRFVIVPLVCSVYFMQKLVLSKRLQQLLIRK